MHAERADALERRHAARQPAHVYARTGHVALVRRAYEALRTAGFDGIRGLGEDYDDQTQMYHAQMECNYTEDVD